MFSVAFNNADPAVGIVTYPDPDNGCEPCVSVSAGSVLDVVIEYTVVTSGVPLPGLGVGDTALTLELDPPPHPDKYIRPRLNISNFITPPST